MAKTKAEIAEKVLQKLGVAESGETIDPAGEDSLIVQDKYDSIYYLLASDNLISWGSAEDIPTEAVTSIVSIVANDCLTEFIIPQDKMMKIMNDAIVGEDNLRKLERVYYIPEETEVHYY